ncbi:hypothetical protein A2870_03155 [Candidatus Curtissbacteria bacterium RIFCSPHIGHO2_01_FULL_41_11]|uniref:DUF2933 domain-containing protein n=1 Tax=Candidatus Curtissbacteria bacterium RIFCSPHIGHO2_01_FULL_41_11 TaxID=1797711 RepID=A0A1F5G743_9BACT|nr:MAG: hypothetical protein A2870_03155 [Candidatus Curtissbacteria bacterium RIFCSPHIGHO2_01_FULL_41_11]
MSNLFLSIFKKHGLLMTLGCLLPLGIIGLFAFFGINQNSLLVLLVLACPLGHIFLMGGHDKKHHE